VQFIVRFVTTLFGLIFAVIVALYLYTKNTDGLKPDIETFINDQTGLVVRINGDLDWQLFPPLSLHIEDVEIDEPHRATHATTLSLKMDLSAMWEDVNQWQVSALNLTDVTITDDGTHATINRLDLTDFTFGKPANLYIDASYTAANAKPIAGTLEGSVTYTPATDHAPESLSFKQTTLTLDWVNAVCDMHTNQNSRPSHNSPLTGTDDLLPLAILRRLDVTADCRLSELKVGKETFQAASLKVTNLSDNLNIHLEISDFLGGSLTAEADANFASHPVRWAILPDINNVDSQRFIDWSNQSMRWVAPIKLNGKIQMRGNTQDQLLASISSDLYFDGGRGEIDVTALKAQLDQLALITGGSKQVASWPDTWAYGRFIGTLKTRGTQQKFKVQLDNLYVDGEGKYDYAEGQTNLLANATFRKAPQHSPFVVHPLLQDTPLPLRCSGSTDTVRCRLDQDAAQALIAGALKRDSDTGLRRKLKDKIDEKVPEAYRDAAHSLLDIIGRSLDRD